jgi:hypothetical protein
MGLFSSKKKYVAYAASSALFPESPNSLKGNILQTSITGSSKAGAIIHTIHTDQFARAKSMMRYAARYDDPARDGGYVRGFPTSNMSVITISPDAIAAALTRAVGDYDSIVTSYTGKWNERFFLSTRLQHLYMDTDYFPWAGDPENTHWDAERESVEIPVANGEVYFTSDNDFVFYRSGGDEYTVTFPYLDGEEEKEWEVTKTIDVGDVADYNWIMVTYRIGEEYFYWAYQIDSGEDPILESYIDAETKEGAFLPVAILMQDKVWFDSDPESEVAKTTNKLLKRLATTGTKIREDFQEQEAEDDASGDKNRSNAKKWDFFIHYAVPVGTVIRGSKEYLWNFYSELRDWSTHTSEQYYDYLASQSGTRYTKPQPKDELNITEGTVNGYNVNYRWSFIETREFVGDYEIEALGGPRALKPKEISNEQYERTDDGQKPEYQAKLNAFFETTVPIGLYDPNHQKNQDNKDWERYGYHDYVLITRAKEDGTGYEQTLIMGLSMQYVINTSDDAGGKKGYRYRYATPHMFGTDEETAEFRIPMLWTALKKVPTLHREEAVADGLGATVFLVEVIKTKWYQTGFFKWLLIIIAITLIVISIWFPLLIEGAVLLLGMALGGGGIALFVAYVVVMFALGYMIALGTSLMSSNMQMILAVVIIVAMLYTGQFSNITSSFQTLIGTPGWATATTFINAVAPLYNMGFSVYSKYQMLEYQSEFEDLIKDQKERQEELEDAWDLMGPVPSYMDPMDLVQTFKRQGETESATSYYNRCLNTNPGILCYEVISNYANIALAPPETPGGETSIVDEMMEDFRIQRG